MSGITCTQGLYMLSCLLTDVNLLCIMVLGVWRQHVSPRHECRPFYVHDTTLMLRICCMGVRTL